MPPCSWLNGSLFASVYAIAHVNQILRSDHSTGRKVVLVFESFYNLLNLIFQWFGIGNYYLFFVCRMRLSQDASKEHTKLIGYLDILRRGSVVRHARY
jgi:chitin synthase